MFSKTAKHLLGIFFIGWLAFSFATQQALAVKADAGLEIRERCETGNCPQASETETHFQSSVSRSSGSEFTLDVYIKNPSRQKVISVQSWLKYNSSVFEILEIDTDGSAFDFVAPGENNFDATGGLIKIGRSAVSNDTKLEELFVAGVRFKVLSPSGGNSIVSFYDYQIGESGHTSVRVMDGNFPVNILESEPKDFSVKLDSSSGTSTSTQTTQTTQSTQETTSSTTQTLNQPLSRPTGFQATSENNYIFLVWDQSDNLNLNGYNLYYSTNSWQYLQRRPVGNVNQYELNWLEKGQTYYLAIKAYDHLNRETDYSDEIRITVGDPNSSSSPLTLQTISSEGSGGTWGDGGDVNIVTRNQYLSQVNQQSSTGPHLFWIIVWLSGGASLLFFGIRRRYV